jgi:NAD(P)-dependent dehydrogenase (short-subunit alcohol dehydrogenase family)
MLGKVVLVTGGSSGIGRAIAERVAADGAAVVIGARRKDLGEDVAAGIRARGGQAVFVPTDVTVESEVAALTAAAISEFGRLDGAVNNVGGVHALGMVHEIDEQTWRAEVDLNLTSVYFGLKHQVGAITAAGGGSIVNNASLAGVGGIPGMSAYTAAKHGVVGLTRSVALEFAKSGVRINALVTGNVDTPLFRGMLPDGMDGSALNPSGRVAEPAEIAAFVAFLLGDESRFITGAALAVDGGFSAQ